MSIYSCLLPKDLCNAFTLAFFFSMQPVTHCGYYLGNSLYIFRILSLQSTLTFFISLGPNFLMTLCHICCVHDLLYKFIKLNHRYKLVIFSIVFSFNKYMFLNFYKINCGFDVFQIFQESEA